MTNIAIVGPMHSGKSTIANILVSQYGYTRIGLADAVKDAVASMLDDFVWLHATAFPQRAVNLGNGAFPVQLDRQEIEDHKAVFRPILQWLGTDFVREYLDAPYFWIHLFREAVKHITGPVVCDDVRFPNEADELRKDGFRIVRLHRPEEERLASVKSLLGATDMGLRHPSETNLEEITPDESWLCSTIADLVCVAKTLGKES